MKSDYDLDHELGLDYFATTSPGIGGRLRENLDDFEVAEIPKEIPTIEHADYTHFTLEKRNWETIGAIKAIAKSLHVSHKRFGYAGNKDRRALTTQRVAAWRIPKEQLISVEIEGIRMFDFTTSDCRLNLGELKGNRFRATISSPSLHGEELEDVVKTTLIDISNGGLPNYFGYQRFGTVRPNTHLVGKEVVRENLEQAVMCYLGRPYVTETGEAQLARRHVDETRDFREALRLFPKKLTYERAMLSVLAKNPRDFAGALRALPKRLRILLVHAYQSYLFNKILSNMIEAELEIRRSRIPLIGSTSHLSRGSQGETEREVLEEEGVRPRDFTIESMPELKVEGGTREAWLETTPRYEVKANEARSGTPKVTIEFDLAKGSYATVVLREFMKSNPLCY